MRDKNVESLFFMIEMKNFKNETYCLNPREIVDTMEEWTLIREIL
jgi:hypothetical protein